MSDDNVHMISAAPGWHVVLWSGERGRSVVACVGVIAWLVETYESHVDTWALVPGCDYLVLSESAHRADGGEECTTAQVIHALRDIPEGSES